MIAFIGNIDYIIIVILLCVVGIIPGFVYGEHVTFFDRWYQDCPIRGKGNLSLLPWNWTSRNPSGISIFGVPYGKGDQKRAFLSLEDSVECLNLILDHPAEKILL